MEMLIRKTKLFKVILIVALFVSLIALPFSQAFATDYPVKPVRLIIAFAPGGSTDAFGRLIATKLSERLGNKFIAENQGGGGGNIASETVARAKPDGYTLLFHSSGIITNPLLIKAPYDPLKSFAPIAKIGRSNAALVVHPSVQANSVKELIDFAKKNPGKLSVAAAGVGSFTHLSAELFKVMTGTDFKIVQFRSGGLAMTDVLGGHSQIFLGSIQQSLPHIQAGKIKALGYGGKTRSRHVPNLPTISEAGVPGYQSFIWWGMFAPAGTPKAIVDLLSKEIEAILKMPDTLNIMETQGAEVDFFNPTELTSFMEAELATWDRVVKQGKIKME